MGDTTQRLLQGISRLLAHGDVKTAAAVPKKPPGGNHSPSDTDAERFSSELFAGLLLELPEHRQALLDAHASHDLNELGRCTHKLLGAVVYCDLPELAGALRQLQQAIRSEDDSAVTPCCSASVQAIEALLARSGLAL